MLLLPSRWQWYFVWRDLLQAALITPVPLDAASVFLALISSLGRGAAGDVCFSNRWFLNVLGALLCSSPPVSALARTFLDICAFVFCFLFYASVSVCVCVCLCVWGSKRERDGGEFLTVCLHCVFDCARECVCVYVTSACWLTGCCSAFWQTVPLNHAAVVTRGDRTPSPPPDSSIRVSHALNEEVNMLNCLL